MQTQTAPLSAASQAPAQPTVDPREVVIDIAG